MLLMSCILQEENKSLSLRKIEHLNMNIRYVCMWLQISSKGSQPKMVPAGGGLSWQSYNEETPSADGSDTLAMSGLWEQVNVTRDSSDYLWYLTE